MLHTKDGGIRAAPDRRGVVFTRHRIRFNNAARQLRAAHRAVLLDGTVTTGTGTFSTPTPGRPVFCLFLAYYSFSIEVQ